MPMSGDTEETGGIYDVMAGAIAAELDRGHDVCFLCEGDPLMDDENCQLGDSGGDPYGVRAQRPVLVD